MYARRRQIQLQSRGRMSMMQATRLILQRDGVPGMYRGFVPNALKNLPNKGDLGFQTSQQTCCCEAVCRQHMMDNVSSRRESTFQDNTADWEDLSNTL